MSETDSENETENELPPVTERLGPEVKLVQATPRPEQIVCTAARNDYMSEWVGETDYAEILRTIDPSDDDREWARDYLAQRNMEYEVNVVKVAKERYLLRKLMTRGHWGPFEHVTATFTVGGLSRSCMSQITRHRLASFDVQSMRYVSFEEVNPREGAIRIPELDDPGLCGRSAEFDEEVEWWDDEIILEERQRIYWRSIAESYKDYRRLLELGTAPENARMVLPIGSKTNLVFTMNARMLLHLIDMRGEADSQWEIRALTEDVIEEFRNWMPITVSYFEDNLKGRKHRLGP